jgi:hypothetical protein
MTLAAKIVPMACCYAFKNKGVQNCRRGGRLPPEPDRYLGLKGTDPNTVIRSPV